jgi:hypothetical protein
VVAESAGHPLFDNEKERSRARQRAMHALPETLNHRVRAVPAARVVPGSGAFSGAAAMAG